MASATLTSKGQITLPKAVRKALNVQPGDRLSFRQLPDGTMVVEPETLDASDLAGSLTARTEVRGVTVDDMKEAVRKAGSRR